MCPYSHFMYVTALPDASSMATYAGRLRSHLAVNALLQETSIIFSRLCTVKPILNQIHVSATTASKELTSKQATNQGKSALFWCP